MPHITIARTIQTTMHLLCSLCYGTFTIFHFVFCCCFVPTIGCIVLLNTPLHFVCIVFFCNLHEFASSLARMFMLFVIVCNIVYRRFVRILAISLHCLCLLWHMRTACWFLLSIKSRGTRCVTEFISIKISRKNTRTLRRMDTRRRFMGN